MTTALTIPAVPAPDADNVTYAPEHCDDDLELILSLTFDNDNHLGMCPEDLASTTSKIQSMYLPVPNPLLSIPSELPFDSVSGIGCDDPQTPVRDPPGFHDNTESHTVMCVSPTPSASLDDNSINRLSADASPLACNRKTRATQEDDESSLEYASVTNEIVVPTSSDQSKAQDATKPQGTRKRQRSESSYKSEADEAAEKERR